MIDKDFVKNVFKRKYDKSNDEKCQNISDLIKKPKRESPADSGVEATPFSNKTSSPETDILQSEVADDLDDLEDLESFFTDEEDLAFDDEVDEVVEKSDTKEDTMTKDGGKSSPEFEDISSEEEWS